MNNAVGVHDSPDATSVQQLQNLFDVSLDLLGVASGGRVVSANPAWTVQLGWSPEDLTSRPFLSFVHPEDEEITRTEIRNLLEGRASSDFRNRMLHRDGSYRSLQWALQPHGGVVYMGGRDITRDVELRHRVERSEAIAVAVLHTAADPIVIIDTSGTILHVNEATIALFGYRYDDMMGCNVSILMPEPYRSEHDQYLARFLAEGDPRIIGVGREVVAQRADGSTFPMALAVSEAVTEQDHLFTGIIHDLTERNRQRDALAAANADLEQRVAARTAEVEEALAETRRSNRDLEQFAYVASHDLQAPLRNVRQGLELLEEHLDETTGAGFDSEALELRGLVVAAAERMEDLIRGLLEFSRVQNAPEFGRERVDLTDLASDALAVLRSDLDGVGAVVDLGRLPVATVNPMQFRQVFQNLFQNAVRYRSADRSLELAIGERSATDGYLRLAVSDNGLGVEAAHHERIFDLFRRGHASHEGVGLGLSICRRVVEAHDGRIWVESAANEGATFVVELPTAPSPDETVR